MFFREMLEKKELETLSPFAQKSILTKGRKTAIEDCPVRTCYMRDRDRIIHCKSFRRMKHKTQVFLAPHGDHYRTRLTHTLEVNQISRTIARALSLNEDLTEAIALGHDLGHTPFGHTGEAVLNELLPGGFRHSDQSARVVEKLENGKGMNLTYEVVEGIRNHNMPEKGETLEGFIVHLADRIAYINHDIDDAVRAGVITAKDIPLSCAKNIGCSHGERINRLVLDILEESYNKPAVKMSGEMESEFNRLRDYMFEHVYENPLAKKEEGNARTILITLYEYYLSHPQKMPDEFYINVAEDGLERAVCDHIACMTDRYAITEYNTLKNEKEL